MRSIRYFGNGTLKMVEAPEPEIKRADEVKIRVAYCGVCGSDLHFKRAELFLQLRNLFFCPYNILFNFFNCCHS